MCITKIDYVENYSVVEQNVVQSGYWSKTQLSIFTAHSWAKPCHISDTHKFRWAATK